MLIEKPPVAVTDTLFMLGASPYPVFLRRGAGRSTLFEAAVGCVGPLVLEQMDSLGLDRESVKQVVITHAHPDHVMALPLFRKAFPDAEVVASEAAAKTLGVEKAVSFFAKIDGAFTQSLTQAGHVAPRHAPEPLAEMRIAVDRVVSDGDSIEVDDGVAFKVVGSPGHSDCSLSFHEPAEGVLIISDAAGYFMTGPDYLWPNYFVDYATYVQSMEKLASLDARVLCLGHNVVIKGADDVKAWFDSAIAGTRAYHERIVAEAKAGKSTREIAEQLGAEIYERCQFLPLDFFQKNCSLMVKLSCQDLETNG